MPEVDLSLDQFIPVSGGGLTIELLMGPMGYLDRQRVLDMADGSERVVERDTYKDALGAVHQKESVRLLDVSGPSEVLRAAIAQTVKDWRGVTDRNRTPIPFSLEVLNIIAGKHREWGDALVRKVCELNGLPYRTVGAQQGAPQTQDDQEPADPKSPSGSDGSPGGSR